MTETDVFNALKYRTYNAKFSRYEWRNRDGQYHRDDGPSIEYDDGEKHWWKNVLRHRIDGPAVEGVFGSGY